MAEEKIVENYKMVEVEYTGTLDDGSEFDSNVGKDPLGFVVGMGMVVPGFEKAVIGMKVGESKTVKVACDDAYGKRNDTMVQEVPKDSVPKEIDLKIGTKLALRSPTGQVVPAEVTKIEDDKVTLDLNHPLADKDLTFAIKVLDVKEPSDEEMSKITGAGSSCDTDSCSSCGGGCGH